MDTNFVQHEEVSKLARQPRRRLLFIVLGVLAVFLILTLFGVGRFLSASLQTKDDIEEAMGSLATLSFEEAQHDVDEAVTHAKGARSGLVFIGWTQALPWIGDHIEAVGILLDASIAGGEAFSEALSIAMAVEDVFDESQALLDENQIDQTYTFDTLPEGFKIELLRALHQQSDAFYEAAIKLDLATAELEELNDLSLSPSFESAIAPLREIIPELADTFDILAPVAQSLDAFAGLDEDKQWMLLFLNDTEIRPGGGFMGVYGLMQISEGSIERMYIDDTYALDQLVEDVAYSVAPPEPLQEYVGADKWYFRDANWSPDFAQSSQDAIALLRQEFAVIGQPVPQIDGVLGLTPTLVSRLLAVIGPVTVDGVAFEPETFTETLEYEVEVNFANRGIAFEDRKQIVSDLMNVLLEEFYDLPIERWPELFSVIHDGFPDKQIALYSTDEEAQQVFKEAGWAGLVDQGRADDVLMIVDANMGALKSDYAVDRSVSYQIVPDEDGYVAKVAITYEHNGTFDYRTTRYRTYTRVYVPPGSTFVSVDGSLKDDALHNPSLEPGEVTIFEELGLAGFGAFTAIEPGETGTLSFTYRLPENIGQAVEDGLYQLAVIKQMGATDNALTLDLDFGTTVTSATPSEQEEQFGDSVYHVNTIIDQDDVITIEF